MARGIYDEGELGRIQNLLDQQRSGFNAEDDKQESIAVKGTKYAIIILGAGVLLLSLKFIINGRTRK